jgi:polysaccharide biosynthesis protein PslG
MFKTSSASTFARPLILLSIALASWMIGCDTSSSDSNPTGAVQPIQSTQQGPQLQALPTAVQDGFGIQLQDFSNTNLDRAAQAGFKVVRLDIWWDEVESVKGQYNFKRYDDIASRMKARGLRPMFILDFNNPLYSQKSDMDAIDTTAEINGFKAYAVATVKRFQATYKPIWEFYNEPNRLDFWKPEPNFAQYVNLVKATVPAIRQAVPSAYIVGPALGHHPDPDAISDPDDKLDYWYLEQAFQAGLLEHLDAVSVHPYLLTKPESARHVYYYLRGLIAKYKPAGKTIPVISSEWGYSTGSYFVISEQIQADYLTRMYLINILEAVPVSIAFKLEYVTFGPEADAWEKGYSLYRANGQAKIAVGQLKTMMMTLNGLSFVQELPASTNDYVMEFSNAARSKTIAAAWTTGAAHMATVYGKKLQLSSKPIFVLK